MLRSLLSLSLLGLAALPLAATTTTQWIAGGGLGEGSQATAVSVLPRAVLAAEDGSLYIADELFNRVRRVGVDGRVESIVGNGGYGLGRDGLPALAAQLGIAEDLALDPSGRLFFVDLGNRSLRYIDRAGAIQTFATPQSPLFASVSGTFAPVSLAIDSQARVHVADRGTHVVWQIDADGRGRRAAGNGERGFSGDGGKSALAQLADPRAVALGADAIWIADTGNRRVRVVAPGGIIWTIAGDGTEARPAPESSSAPLATSLKPIDLQVSEEGILYILDELGAQVLRVDGIDLAQPNPAAKARLSIVARFDAATGAVGLSIDAQGDLVVADYGGRRVLRLDPDDNDVESPRLLLAGNGRVRAAGDGGDARNASLYQPAATAITPAGTLYLADSGNDLIRRIEVDGRISTVEIDSSWSLHHPTGVAVDEDGGLYVTATDPAQVLYRDATGHWTRVVSDDQLQAPAAVAVDLDGQVLVVDAARRIVARIADGRAQPVAGNGAIQPVGDGGPATQTALLRPVDVAVDAEGLWVVDAGAHSLYRLTGDGLLRRFAGTGEPGLGAHGSQARSAALSSPSSVAADGVGGAYVADAGNRRVVHVDASGVLHVLNTHDEIQRPTALTWLPSGELLVSDGIGHRLIRLRHQVDVAPLAQRLRQMDPTMMMRVIGELDLAGASQVIAGETPDQILVRHAAGVSQVHPDGTHDILLAADPGGALAVVSVPELGPVVARVSSARLQRSKPLTLIRTGEGVADQTFDLDDRFDGAEAIAVDGGNHLYFYQSDGTILRLAADGLLNIPGFADWAPGRAVGEGALQVWAQVTPGAVALAAVETGTLVAAATNGDIWWLRDHDGDGRVDERKRMATLSARPTALAVFDGQIYAGTADALYRVHENGVDLVAEGFAPRLLSLTSTAGRLLALEGSGTAARVVEITAARAQLLSWPETIDFGATGLGQAVIRTVVLRNEGGRSVRLQHGEWLQSGDPSDPSDVIELLPGESRQLQVTRLTMQPGVTDDEIIWSDEAGAQLLRMPTRIHGLAPRLVVEEGLDFGLAWVGAPARRSLELSNQGDAALVVTAIELDDAATFTLADGVQLPARLKSGDTLSLRLTFVPTAGTHYETDLRVLSDDPLSPHVDVRLQGQGGRALLSIEGVDEQIELGSVVVGTRRRYPLILLNDGEMDLRVGQIFAGTQRLVITPRRLVVPAGGQAELLIDFQPLVHGTLEGLLQLYTDDPSRPRRVVAYRGFGVTQQIELSVPSLDFGATGWATTARLEIEVTNHGRSNMRLTSMRTNRREFRILRRPASIAPGESDVVTIGYAPSDAGAVDGLLTMTTDLPEAPTLTVSLKGRPRTVVDARLDVPDTPQALWPNQVLEVPLRITGAHGLRGVVLDLGYVPAPLRFTGVMIPDGSLLQTTEAPLVIESTDAEGQVQIGLSVAGEGGVDGEGIVAILRFGWGEVTVDSSDAQVSSVAPMAVTMQVRNVDGVSDSVRIAAPAWPSLSRRGDLNGDGVLGLDDVYLLMSAFPDRSSIAFEQYDLNGDGQISWADIDALLQHLPAQAAARAIAFLDGESGDVELASPHPNPFNAETVLTIHVPRQIDARLVVHNTVGQRVRTLWTGALSAGSHRMTWDGRDEDGRHLRTGVYFVSLVTDDVRRVHRLLLLR
ncbi:MAG: choice-of-anchor D domain-containing protein [Gemmatimonadetes bacterium]|jgi:sugar lactone lactonase YvrE|nr:choice-of-anchor D domain-containing protein [Gemmatimonadota bacterium]